MARISGSDAAAWKALSSKIEHHLKAMSAEPLIFRCSHQSIVGFPEQSFRSDGMLTDGNALLAVEFEAGQNHPDTNVTKYWMLWHQYKKYERIVLIHIYTPLFSSYPWRMELGRFIAEQMRGQGVPLDYVLMDERGSRDWAASLERITRVINLRARELF